MGKLRRGRDFFFFFSFSRVTSTLTHTTDRGTPANQTQGALHRVELPPMAGTMQRSARETWKQNKNKVALCQLSHQSHSEKKEKVGSRENNNRVVAKKQNERITLCTRIRGKRRLERNKQTKQANKASKQSKQSKQTNPIPSHQKGGRQRMETKRASQGQRRGEQGPRRQRKKLIRKNQTTTMFPGCVHGILITMERNKRRKNVPAAK